MDDGRPGEHRGVSAARGLAYAAAIVLVLIVALVAGMSLRDRDNTTAAPSPATASAPVPSGSATPAAATASATASTATSVLDERLGFVVYTGSGRTLVRSETSDAEISAFVSEGRSFSSLSNVVSPDGRLVAYWEPVNNGAVLHVRSVTGGTARTVLTSRPEMSGNAFTWSSDSGGLVAALDNNCFEICGGPGVAELWTIDLASGATEKIASGAIWLPVAWDRAGKLVAAGVTGPGGYLVGYDLIDLQQKPYPVRSTPYRPTVLGRLKASSDARYVLLSTDQGSSSALAWWPLAEPQKRSAVEFDGATAEWRPGTSQIWWVGGLTPSGCRVAPCAGTELVSFDVATAARAVAFRGRVGPYLAGFRVDGSAAIAVSHGSGPTPGSNATDMTFVEIATGRTASVSVSGVFGASVRVR